jgi:hypothetical protein
MGHCGNSAAKKAGDTILSLRAPVPGHPKARVVKATFIFNTISGLIGEMKGYDNEKPEPDTHPYIMELLKLEMVKGIRGGGHAAHNNFSLGDLTEEQRAELKEIRPDLVSGNAIVLIDELDLEGFEFHLINNTDETPSGSNLDRVTVEEIRSGDLPSDGIVVEVPNTGWGDYGGSILDRVNASIFWKDYGNIEGVHKVHGGYSFEQLYVDLSALKENEDVLESMKELLEYGYLEDTSGVESDLLYSMFEEDYDFYHRDIVSEMKDILENAEPSDTDLETFERNNDLILEDDDIVKEMYLELMRRKELDFEADSATSLTLRLRDVFYQENRESLLKLYQELKWKE